MLETALNGRDCEAMEGATPKVCGVLDAFGLSAKSFHAYIAGTVPVNDVSRQAPFDTSPR